jgi:peptidoglycan/xylan/chitin deacetylase (PgdA/CDA1 family)
MISNSIAPKGRATVASRKRRTIRSVLRALSRFSARRRKNRTIVLMYHAIGNSVYAVSPEEFEAQMAYLKGHARVVALDRILISGYPKTEASLTCAITFDDGYAGVYQYAYPILRRHSFPAVLYVTTAALDRNGTRAPHHIDGFFPNEPTLTWSQTQEMSKWGIAIGSHLCHHLDMRELSPETGRQELIASKEIISGKIGELCEHFAYPYGFFNSRNVQWVKETGYKSAVTVRHRVVPYSVEPLCIPRMGVAPETSSSFEGMLRGDLDYLFIVREIRQLLGLPI